MVRVGRCPSGHVLVEEEDYYEDEPVCDECEAPYTEVTAPDLLLEMTEHGELSGDTERAHQVADLALFRRVQQLDPAFADRYAEIQEAHSGFWFG